MKSLSRTKGPWVILIKVIQQIRKKYFFKAHLSEKMTLF